MARGTAPRTRRLSWLGLFAGLALQAAGAAPPAAPAARTPIEHVIVVVGENRTFDNLFGVYEPPRGQRVANLLSRGIVRRDGRPGPNFALATQHRARSGDAYAPTPELDGAYDELPPLIYAGTPGHKGGGLDARFTGARPNGPYQISPHAGAAAHTGDPVHRFFQMWQQIDGGRNDLFVWAAETAGAGPAAASLRLAGAYRPGALAMGFFNMAAGDLPYLRQLAQQYALADNHHQAVMGGTTANYFALATADVATYSVAGGVAVPPTLRIENPDPLPGTNNAYRQDSYETGAYVQCADLAQPGVAGIRELLRRQPYAAFNDGNCAPGTYYLVNNLDPAFTPTGEPIAAAADAYRMTAQTMPSIGDALSAAGLPWKWYSGGRRNGGDVEREYCATCDPLSTFTSTMTGPDRHRLQDLGRFFDDLKDARGFPAVAFVAPNDSASGHPGYSNIAAFESLVRKVVEGVRGNPALWQRTAIIVTFDEGGGYYDSGYVQFIDFFGDGTRVPLLAVSPHARRGHVGHGYTDHASIIKFIRANWGLPPLSPRSRDNLPNPKPDRTDPYVPSNRPAIGDLMDLFDFGARPRKPRP